MEYTVTRAVIQTVKLPVIVIHRVTQAVIQAVSVKLLGVQLVVQVQLALNLSQQV